MNTEFIAYFVAGFLVSAIALFLILRYSQIWLGSIFATRRRREQTPRLHLLLTPVVLNGQLVKTKEPN
jgi:hypothetical protein